MPGPLDLNTEELKTILEWGVEDYICSKERVTALIAEVLRERERADEAERSLLRLKSELEMAKAKVQPMQAHAPKKPEYKDGVRYANPPSTSTGADGFPSPIISQ
jgi:hypothetical protein